MMDYDNRLNECGKILRTRRKTFKLELHSGNLHKNLHLYKFKCKHILSFKNTACSNMYTEPNTIKSVTFCV